MDNDRMDELIAEWKEKPFRRGIATCPCGKETSNRYITAHHEECEVWQYYESLMADSQQPAPAAPPAKDPPVADDKSSGVVAGFIKDLITAKVKEFKEAFGVKPDRLYVGKNQLSELQSVVKDSGAWQPDCILGMEVFLVKENNHLYLAGHRESYGARIEALVAQFMNLERVEL